MSIGRCIAWCIGRHSPGVSPGVLVWCGGGMRLERIAKYRNLLGVALLEYKKLEVVNMGV